MVKAPVKSPVEPFFVGYFSKVPAAIALFSVAVGASLIGAFAAIGFLLAASTDATDGATYAPDTAVTGVYQAKPYPLVRIAPSAEHPLGRALLLSGDGKRGAQSVADAFAGQTVDVTGFGLKRGSIDMLIVEKIAAAATKAADPSAIVPLGRWRIGGEVCDGKCVGGAMKPGTGLAHKGCANLCIAGGLPPLLVTAQPVEGSTFMLMADASGGPLAAGTWENYVARPSILEGDLERHGDLLVLRVDWSKAAFP
jgi:hypothetical protein